MNEIELKEAQIPTKGVLKDEIDAMAFLKRADKRTYGNLQEIGLRNSFLLGKNDYTTTLSNVLKILNSYKSEWP